MGDIDFNLPAGTKIFVGAPAKPMDQWIVRSIAELVAPIPEVVEAYLPQCYLPEVMRQPAQVLVVILSPIADSTSVLERLRAGLRQLPVPTHHLDIWRLSPDSQILATVRSTGCKIGINSAYEGASQDPPKKAWWKIW